MALTPNRQLMTYLKLSFWPVLMGFLAVGCHSGIQDIDFESKQFTATYPVDSTNAVDTASLSDLLDSKAIYRFGKGGKGTNHIQIGMQAKDTPFTWKVEGDSLRINNTPYAVQKQGEAFMLRSDSARLILSQQP